MSLVLLSKDLIKYLLNFCFDADDEDLKLRYISRLAQTCKNLETICQKFINDNTYTFHIYQKSSNIPDIVDIYNKIYQAYPLGNYLWFICVKQTYAKLQYIDEATYSQYGGSERVFESKTTLKCEQGQIKQHYESMIDSICFTIYYKANFGEILMMTWYEGSCYWKHYHVRMTWTPGDVWIAMVMLHKWNDVRYRYEVCVDHGGPIIRKEDQYKVLRSGTPDVRHDLWNFTFQ
jgi:hypothetical protein